MNTIYFVVPCYNEEAVLSETVKTLNSQLGALISGGHASPDSRILFVDDGSHDRTWQLIADYSEKENYICGLKLSRNCGHQNAVLAGLMIAKDFADAIISLDADLQDDTDVIPQFVQKFEEGNDIVYGVRKSRATDTFFKRGTAHGFYKLMAMMGVELVADHADYRLMSKRAVESLSQFREVNLFLRGMMPLIGFKTANVYYERHERFAGESKYPFKKMIAFAIDGITSFSIVPLRIITGIGSVIFLISIAALVYSLVAKLTGGTQAGWASIVGSIWLIGGLQLLCFGICGEYIGKIYKEVKARPHYIIEHFLGK
jgi:glycosyltransferase involved in cell wall biosynthesis